MTQGRLAVVGCGRWGTNLLRDFVALRGVEGVVACDADPVVRASASAAYPGITVRADAAEVWRDTSVNAVAVATGVASHARIALAAIAAGKHVLVEKPLAATVEDAEALVDAAMRAGVVLMVDHLLLTDPAFEAVGRLIAEGRLGTLQHIYARRTNLGVVRSEENALWSLGPHDIAVMLRLFGASPDRVLAQGGSFVQPDQAIEDVVFVSLEFPGGRLGHLHCSWLDPAKLRQVTFVGSEAMAVIDDAESDRLRLFRRRAVRTEAGVVTRDEGIEAIPLVDDPPLLRMCRAFLACVEHAAPNPSDGALALNVVRVLARAQAALDNSRSPGGIGA